MNFRFRIILVLLILLFCDSNVRAEFDSQNKNIHQFLELARRPPVQECWAILNGSVRHKGNRKSIKNVPIEIRAHLTPDKVKAQVIFDQFERYLVKQRFSADDGNGSVKQQAKADGTRVGIREIGLRPDDITLSFLYWNFVKEYSEERVRGQGCRVIKLRRPQDQEYVKVWISKKYFFPLRVKWFHPEKETSYRTLEFTGFEKIKDAWIIKELKISGSKWKTIVKLKKNIVELISPSHSIPNDLFLIDTPIESQ